MADQKLQNAVVIAIVVSLKKDMDDIKKRLDFKQPVLLVEEAVEGFKAYLKESAKPNTQRSFNYPLGEFFKEFSCRNMAEIPGLEIQGFLAKRWGGGKKSVLKQTLSKLKWFFSWSVKYVQFKGMPPFLNPCNLIEVNVDMPQERPEFVSVAKMVELLENIKDERSWLMIAILLTSGMRVSELIGDSRAGKPGLLRRDINGRVLSILFPKSGRKEEFAVIPIWVSERLCRFVQKYAPENKIFTVSYSSIRDIIRIHGKWVEISLTPHCLRKWCASYWNRLSEHSMTNFILRHSSTKANDITLVTTLGARYIAPLSLQEVMERQDQFFNIVSRPF